MDVEDLARKVFIFFYRLTVGLVVELVKQSMLIAIVAVAGLMWLVVGAFTVWQTYARTHNAALTLLVGCGAVAGGYVVIILVRRLALNLWLVAPDPKSSTDVLQLLLPEGH